MPNCVPLQGRIPPERLPKGQQGQRRGRRRCGGGSGRRCPAPWGGPGGPSAGCCARLPACASHGSCRRWSSAPGGENERPAGRTGRRRPGWLVRRLAGASGADRTCGMPGRSDLLRLTGLATGTIDGPTDGSRPIPPTNPFLARRRCQTAPTRPLATGSALPCPQQASSAHRHPAGPCAGWQGTAGRALQLEGRRGGMHCAPGATRHRCRRSARRPFTGAPLKLTKLHSSSHPVQPIHRQAAMSEGAFALLAGPMAEAGENGHDPTKLISFFAQARVPSPAAVCSQPFRTVWVDWGGVRMGGS